MSDVFVLTAHARTVLEARSIPLEWVERVFERPARFEVDSEDPDLRHALGRIEENGGRVLRVVYNEMVVPRRIVTVYFDRAMRSES